MKSGLSHPDGPLWSSDYLNQTAAVTNARSITWGSEQTHNYECINTYLSRCGDGYIDVS